MYNLEGFQPEPFIQDNQLFIFAVIMMMMMITTTAAAAAAKTTTRRTIIVIIVIVVVVVVVVIIITLKGANRDFYNLLTAPRTVSNTPAHNRVQITCNTSSAYHVQHAVRRDSSAIKFDGVEIAFILALSYWLNH